MEKIKFLTILGKQVTSNKLILVSYFRRNFLFRVGRLFMMLVIEATMFKQLFNLVFLL